MDITPIIPEGHNVISAYGKGYFKINDKSVNGNIIIGATSIEEWNFSGITIEVEDLGYVVNFAKKQDNNEPLILLLGSGEEVNFEWYNLSPFLQKYNISLELMTTPAACRTYNILLSEGRRVMAALIAI